MIHRTKKDGVIIEGDDGDIETKDIEYEDETFAEENDKTRIRFLIRNLNKMGLTVMNKKGRVVTEKDYE